MFAYRRAQSGTEFLPHIQHRVVAIACLLRTREQLRVWSLGDESSPEPELLTRFFDGIERYSPDLVSWNGGGFDLPVLHYRCLRGGVAASRYWETGDNDNTFRYNNYLSRFHWRHLDLMDVLAGFQPRARASLADTAALLGFPGKLGFSGAQVWDAYLEGQLAGDTCAATARPTCSIHYLIYLRFQLLRGHLDPPPRLDAELERAARVLLRESKADRTMHRVSAALWESPA